MRDSMQNLFSLSGRLVGSKGPGLESEKEVFASGHASLDAYLDGGFQRGQLHEIFAKTAEDNGSATNFAAMVALCGLEQDKGILWLRTIGAMRKGGRFHPAGLVELGGDPGALFMAVAPDDKALLQSASDALRCDAFGVVIVECWGSPSILDLTACRRLTLAAGRSGVTAIMLRLDAREQHSTASTRWSVGTATSTPLTANAPGHPTFDLSLLRRRAGPSDKSWLVEWDRDERSFRRCVQAQDDTGSAQPEASVSRGVVPFFSVGQVAAKSKARLSA